MWWWRRMKWAGRVWPRVRDGKEDQSKQSTEGRGRHFDSGHEVLMNRLSRVQDCLTTKPLFSLQNGNRYLKPASCSRITSSKDAWYLRALYWRLSLRLHRENRAVQKYSLRKIREPLPKLPSVCSSSLLDSQFCPYEFTAIFAGVSLPLDFNLGKVARMLPNISSRHVSLEEAACFLWSYWRSPWSRLVALVEWRTAYKS